MDTYTFRHKVEKYTEEAIKDLKEAKEINDLEQQCSKVSFDVRKHKQNLEELNKAKPEDISRYENYLPYNLDKYEKKVKELDDYWGEVAEKSNKIKSQKQKKQRDKEYNLKSSCCVYCKSTPPTNHYIYSEKNKILKPRKRNAKPYEKEHLFCSETHFEKWHQKNYYCCAECLTENYTGKYKYNKKQKDGQKFCSDNCYHQHYAETCDNCLEKCVSSYQNKAAGHAQTYYSDRINKTGTLCLKCHKEQLKEENEQIKKDQEWEENCKRLDKSMDDLVEGMEESIKGEELNNSDTDNSSDDPVSNSNATEDEEREQLQSRQSQLLSQISQLEQNPALNQAQLEAKRKQLKELQEQEKKLTNSLPINTQISILKREIKELENKSNKSQAEQALLDSKKKELEELLKKQSNSNVNGGKPSDKTILCLSLGIVGILLIFGLFIFLKKHRKRPVKA